MRELLKTSVRVSIPGLCIFDRRRSCIVGAGHMWGREEEPRCPWSVREPPLSAGRGWAKNDVIGPQARPQCPQPAWLRHYKTVVASFLLGLSYIRGLVPPWRTIVETSSTLNMSLPFLSCQPLHPPQTPSPTPMVLVLR